MEFLDTLVKSWWFWLIIGMVLGIVITMVLVAWDSEIVRLKGGLVVTERKYIDGLNKQIERLMEEIRNNS